MAKKSFMNNPAESFFSEAPVATAAQEIFKGTPAAAEPGSPLVTAFIKNREEQTQTEKPAVSPKDDDGMVGRIVSVSSLKVEVFLKKTDICIRDLLYTEADGVRYMFEVQEIDGSVAAVSSAGCLFTCKRAACRSPMMSRSSAMCSAPTAIRWTAPGWSIRIPAISMINPFP